MPVTSPPITREALTGLQQGEEPMLERLFREHYAELVDEAKPIVGDDASAARVVERAFVRVWKERAGIETPDALSAFLHEAVHDQAKVALHKKVMLHRIEEHEGAKAHAGLAGAPSVDEAWRHVNEAIHVATLDRKELAREQAEHSRHEAAAHLGAVGKGRSLKGPIAGGVVALAALVALLWYFDRAGAAGSIVRAVSGPDVRVLKSATGQIGNLVLDDSTVVRIGADSRLYVPQRFPLAARAGRLEGAATFGVKPIPDQPFHVVAGNAMITTTGTTFQVSAYPTDSVVAVRVSEGGVTVKVGDEERAVTAGKALAILPSGQMSEPQAALASESFGWADGRFIIAGRPLRQALQQFTRWYGLELKVPNPALLDRPVTLDASLDSSRMAIGALEKSTGLEFAYEGKVMMLREPAAKPAAKPGRKK